MNRSAECRKDCSAYQEYARIKADEYELRAKVAESYRQKIAQTAAAKSMQVRHERARQRGKCHWR